MSLVRLMPLVFVLSLLLSACSVSNANDCDDSCLQENAVVSGDSALCENIASNTPFVSKDACYNQVAQKMSNKQLCQKIEQQELKDNCLENTK